MPHPVPPLSTRALTFYDKWPVFLVSGSHQRGTQDPDLFSHVPRLVEGHSPGPYSPYSRRPGLLVSDVRLHPRMVVGQLPPPAGVQLGWHPPYVISHVLRCRCSVPNCNLDPTSTSPIESRMPMVGHPMVFATHKNKQKPRRTATVHSPGFIQPVQCCPQLASASTGGGDHIGNKAVPTSLAKVTRRQPTAPGNLGVRSLWLKMLSVLYTQGPS